MHESYMSLYTGQSKRVKINWTNDLSITVYTFVMYLTMFSSFNDNSNLLTYVHTYVNEKWANRKT